MLTIVGAERTNYQFAFQHPSEPSSLCTDEIITEAQSDTDITSPRQVSPGHVHAAEAALNRLRGNTAAAWWLAQKARSAGEIIAEMMLEAKG